MQLPKDLMISISGIRGKIPGSLTPEIAAAFATAFAQVSPAGPIVLSRDSRASGKLLRESVIQALSQQNRQILDADLIPLPTTQIAVEETKAAGAIDITASHNPIEWNGLKFLGPDGMFIRQDTLDALLAAITKLSSRATSLSSPLIKDINKDARAWHIARLKPYFLAGKPLTVGVDATNGAGSYIVPELLKAMDCQTLPVAITPDGTFPHTPEPIPQNLLWTQEQLKDKSFDVCVVVDPDADRLVLIDENGQLLPEETTLPLVAKELALQGRTGTAVVNMSTSRMVEDIGQEYNFKVVRSKVGEINVVDKMKETDSFFGGEGNGGIIDPKIHYGRDSLVGITHILNLMRRTNKKLSQLASELPKYVMKKTKVSLGSTAIEQIYLEIENNFPGASLNREDGLRIDWEDSWLHIRPSNTEPIVRIIGEGKDETELDRKIEIAQKIVGRTNA